MQPYLALTDERESIGQLPAALPEGTYLGAGKRYPRFEAFFDVVVIKRFAILRNGLIVG
jgi:hypothetical protein